MAKRSLSNATPAFWGPLLGAIFGAVVIAALALAGAFAAQWYFGGSMVAWYGSVGTILAIAAGVLSATRQISHTQRRDIERRTALGVVAYELANHALDIVTDRLEVAIEPRRPGSRFELRKLRATETIEALKQIDPANLPSEILRPYIELRSCVAAINDTLSRLYAETEKVAGGVSSQRLPLRDAHPKELASCARVHQAACVAHAELSEVMSHCFGVKRLPSPDPQALLMKLTN